jgi:hypothetical protein
LFVVVYNYCTHSSTRILRPERHVFCECKESSMPFRVYHNNNYTSIIDLSQQGVFCLYYTWRRGPIHPFL